jgi:hypothetical protein
MGLNSVNNAELRSKRVESMTLGFLDFRLFGSQKPSAQDVLHRSGRFQSMAFTPQMSETAWTFENSKL